MVSIDRSSISLREVYQAIFRHKGKVALIFLCVMACTIQVTLFGSRAYRSEARLLVRLGRENVVLDPTVTLGQGSMVSLQQSRDTEINSVAEMLKSRELLEQVVETIGAQVILGSESLGSQPDPAASAPASEAAASSPPWHTVWLNAGRTFWRQLRGTAELTDRDRATLALAKNLRVEPVRKSNLVAISCEAGSAELSRRIVAKLIDFYLEKHLQVNRVPGSYEFLTTQAAHLRDELSQAEAQLRDVKNATGLISPVAQRDNLVARIGRLEDELVQANNEKIAAQTRTARLRETLSTLPQKEVTSQTDGYPDMGTDTMRSQYYALQLAEQEARAKYTPDHPRYQEIVRQSEESRRILARESPTRIQTTTVQPKVYEETRSALIQQEPVIASLQAKAARLEAELAALRGNLQTLNENELRVARLQREVELKEGNYRRYAANLEQARIDQVLETQRMSNISVVQPATFEPKPVRPRLLLNLTAGFAVALFSSLGMALVLESLDHSLRTPEDVERRLELPALASIPRYRMVANWRD